MISSSLARRANKPSRLQSRQRAGARPELVRLDPEALQHRDIEITQRRRLGGIERQVLAVLEATAGDEDRQVARRVRAARPKIAAEEDHGAVQERLVLLLGLLELAQEIAECGHRLQLDFLELVDLGRVLTVMRQVVMPL